MDIVTKQDLELLTRERAGSCVSLYLRTQGTGSEMQQDPIRFSNMLPPVQQELVALGISPQEARSIIRPARALVSDTAFWHTQSQGLAVFLANGFIKPYRLPMAFDDILVVNNRFLLNPLLPVLCDDTEYCLLVLSQSKIRLFRGTRFGLEKVIAPGVPEGMQEAISQEQNETLQQHPGRATTTAAKHSEVRADKNISQYFLQVNKGILRFLQDRNSPLVIAGVDYLLPLYRRANTYPGLRPEEITGNLDALRAEALHKRTWPLVEQIFGKIRQKALHEVNARLKTGGISTSPSEIVPASYQGRVSTLLLHGQKHEWGMVDRAHAGTVSHICGQEEQGCEDLYDFAAIHTVLKGGKVFVTETESIGKGAPITALFRE